MPLNKATFFGPQTRFAQMGLTKTFTVFKNDSWKLSKMMDALSIQNLYLNLSKINSKPTSQILSQPSSLSEPMPECSPSWYLL